ncbi:hypothetical protein [Verrucomicrobium spinosum]|uniref:hypothetical protein n=1 Tax=Verrucomicrobium spinosum TaxID=2736 RepID=UPI0009464A3D|nr:hypothetical protein [Verrucomicrobium spinosum]
MNQTIRINEAYQFLLRPPGEEKSPLATARRLTLPTAPVLAEPKVEQIPPRILGPRLRLPPAPVVAASPAFTPVGQNRTNSGGSGVLTPRTPSGTASSFTPMPPPTAVRPAPAQVQPFRLTMPWMIGIGGVIALMIFWSFTQAGLTSRLRRPFFSDQVPPHQVTAAHFQHRYLRAPHVCPRSLKGSTNGPRKITTRWRSAS